MEEKRVVSIPLLGVVCGGGGIWGSSRKDHR